MGLRDILIDLLENKFKGNKQKFVCSIKNSKSLLELRNLIIDSSLFLVNPSWSQRLYHTLNNLEKIHLCYCGKEVKFFDLSKGYNKYCSPECRHNSKEMREKIEKTNLERYGFKTPGENKDIKNKVKQTNLERYGYESHNSSEIVKEKKKQVCLEKYGVENVSQVDFVKEKRKETFLERFGVENPNQNENIKKKKKEYFLEKYGVEWFTQDKEIREQQTRTLKKGIYENLVKSIENDDKVKVLFSQEEYMEKRNLSFLCLKCNKTFLDQTDHKPRCLDCYPLYKGFSFMEKEIVSWLKEEFKIINIIENSRKIIPPYGLDIYLPDYNLAIEFNGLFWHSELGNSKDSEYHKIKTELCSEKGIQLIHIFQDEWVGKQTILQSIIKSKLSKCKCFFARKTMYREISRKEGADFFTNNHLQGNSDNIIRYFGLFYGQELTFVIGIGKSRYNKNYVYELIRSCSLLNTVVIGGFDKLMKNIPLKGSIISYVDRRYFKGNSYKSWNYIEKTSPNYYYLDRKKGIIRESRLKYQKHKLPKLFPDVYDKDLTEWEIMQLAGYDRIWDCGNLVYSRIL